VDGRVGRMTKGQANKGDWRAIRKRERKETDIRKLILQMKRFPVEFSTGLTLALNKNSGLRNSSSL
jgi:hypothetical protein